MISPDEAERLRGLIVRYAHCRYQAGRMTPRTDAEVRRRINNTSDVAERVMFEALDNLTQKETEK